MSTLKRNIYAYKAGGDLLKGQSVKFGADKKTVVKCAANTDRAIGIVQGDALTGADCEVAHPGGGAFIKLGETVSFGKFVVPHTDGSLVMANAAGDNVIAQTLEDGVAGDIVSAQVVVFQASGAES